MAKIRLLRPKPPPKLENRWPAFCLSGSTTCYLRHPSLQNNLSHWISMAAWGWSVGWRHAVLSLSLQNSVYFGALREKRKLRLWVCAEAAWIHILRITGGGDCQQWRHPVFPVFVHNSHDLWRIVAGRKNRAIAPLLKGGYCGLRSFLSSAASDWSVKWGVYWKNRFSVFR